MKKNNATTIGEIKIITFEWYVPHYTPSIPQQTILSEKILNKIPTELQYVESSVFMKEVNTQNLWTFELGTQEDINIPSRDTQGSQNYDNDTFYRPPITSNQRIIGTEKDPDSGILINYDDHDYSQGYGQVTETFRAFTKMISFNRIYLIKVLGHDKMMMILIKIYTFLVYDIRKIWNLVNQQR